MLAGDDGGGAEHPDDGAVPDVELVAVAMAERGSGWAPVRSVMAAMWSQSMPWRKPRPVAVTRSPTRRPSWTPAEAVVNIPWSVGSGVGLGRRSGSPDDRRVTVTASLRTLTGFPTGSGPDCNPTPPG